MKIYIVEAIKGEAGDLVIYPIVAFSSEEAALKWAGKAQGVFERMHDFYSEKMRELYKASESDRAYDELFHHYYEKESWSNVSFHVPHGIKLR